MPRLMAEEALTTVTRYAVGTGSMKPADQSEQIALWRSLIEPESPKVASLDEIKDFARSMGAM